jgi:hypothetical protein
MTGMRVITTELGLVDQTPPQAVSRQRARGIRALVRRAPRKQRRGIIEAAHWAFGASGGAAFGALPRDVRRIGGQDRPTDWWCGWALNSVSRLSWISARPNGDDRSTVSRSPPTICSTDWCSLPHGEAQQAKSRTVFVRLHHRHLGSVAATAAFSWIRKSASATDQPRSFDEGIAASTCATAASRHTSVGWGSQRSSTGWSASSPASRPRVDKGQF